MRSFGSFALRSTVVHLVTYLVIGGLSYYLIARPEWSGPALRPWMRNPESALVQQWLIPAQLLRGVLHAVALFPLRDALLRMGNRGGLVVALLLMVLGHLAGIDGVVEQALYTTIFDVRLSLIHLPEAVVQMLLYGYLLLGWERRAERRPRFAGAGR